MQNLFNHSCDGETLQRTSPSNWSRNAHERTACW